MRNEISKKKKEEEEEAKVMIKMVQPTMAE